MLIAGRSIFAAHDGRVARIVAEAGPAQDVNRNRAEVSESIGDGAPETRSDLPCRFADRGV
jgi:hypothetical protein